MVQSILTLLPVFASVLTGSVLGHPSSWCDNNEALEVYDRATMGPEFLPAGGVDMVDYDFDAAHNWYISAKDLDERQYQLWKVTADGSVRTTLLHDKADSIAVKADGSGIFAIVDNCINLYSTSGAGRIDKVKDSSRHYTWSGLYYDDAAQALYATDSENNKVYRFVKRTFSWDSDVVISGQGNGSKKLDEPAGIRKFGNTLFIVQTGGRDNTVVSWDIGSSQRNYEFNFDVTGKFGIEVLDGYIFYRYDDDSVYRRKWNSPAGKSELVVGGCRPGSHMNQITNDGTGALRGYDCDLIVWDFTRWANRFVEWDDSWCSAATTTSTTTTSTTTTSTTTTSTTTTSTTTTSTTTTSTTTTSTTTTSTTTTSTTTTSTTTTSTTTTSTTTTSTTTTSTTTTSTTTTSTTTTSTTTTSTTTTSTTTTSTTTTSTTTTSTTTTSTTTTSTTTTSTTTTSTTTTSTTTTSTTTTSTTTTSTTTTSTTTTSTTTTSTTTTSTTTTSTTTTSTTTTSTTTTSTTTTSTTTTSTTTTSTTTTSTTTTSTTTTSTTTTSTTTTSTTTTSTTTTSTTTTSTTTTSTTTTSTTTTSTTTTSTTTTSTTTTSTTTTSTTTTSTTTVSTTTSGELKCDAYCDSMQSGSYCMYYKYPSVCSGTNLPCSCGDSTTTAVTTSTVHTTVSVSSTAVPTTKPHDTTTISTTTKSCDTTTTTTTTTPCGGGGDLQCDDFCNSVHPGTYCKYWQIPSVCSGTDTPCNCTE